MLFLQDSLHQLLSAKWRQKFAKIQKAKKLKGEQEKQVDKDRGHQ